MRWLRYNLGYKLLAVTMAVALWAYVHVEEGPQQRTLADKVHLRNVPAGLVPTLERDRVDVTLVGPANRLETLTEEDVETWIDLRAVAPGRVYHLPVQCTVNRDSDLLRCQPAPDHVAVRIDERISRTIPISVFVSGTPPLGYVYARAMPLPGVATISGLRRDVARVTRLVATAVTNGRAVNDRAAVLPLDSRGNTVAGLDVEPGSVAIRAPLRLEPASKELLVDPRTAGRPAAGYTVVGITTLPLAVIARGDASALANLRAVETRRVDLGGVDSPVTIRVGLEPVTGIEFEPSTVNIMIDVQRLPRRDGPAGPVGPADHPPAYRSRPPARPSDSPAATPAGPSPLN